jgi:curved DNA-binding protein CbpA
MDNPFQLLGIEPALVIDPDLLRERFREAGRSLHPDGGGSEAGFAALREAFETLASPARRLRLWLELRGETPDSRGTLDPEVMDVFSEISDATRQAEGLIRKREESRTVLGLALLERQTLECRDAIERALAVLEQAIARQCAPFPAWEVAAAVAPEAPGVARNLAFLEKWKLSLQALFARLV